MENKKQIDSKKLEKLIPETELGQDDGPLTSQQIEKIRKLSTATDIPEERYANALF